MSEKRIEQIVRKVITEHQDNGRKTESHPKSYRDDQVLILKNKTGDTEKNFNKRVSEALKNTKIDGYFPQEEW